MRTKVVTKEILFSNIKAAAHIGSINLAGIKGSYFMELIVGICKQQGFKASQFNFTVNEFESYIKSQGVIIL